MYDNEKTIWFSQTLLTFKDKQFATDGYLKVAISTNTEDYKYFNPPLFNISVSTNIQKSYNLNIQQMVMKLLLKRNIKKMLIYILDLLLKTLINLELLLLKLSQMKQIQV